MYVDAAQYLPEHSRGWSLDLGIADISENSNRSSISARATAVAGGTTQIKTVGMPLVKIAHGVYIGKVACDVVCFFQACVVHAQFAFHIKSNLHQTARATCDEYAPFELER